MGVLEKSEHPKKRDKILEHSALNLNRPFKAHSVWDEDLIEERSKTLRPRAAFDARRVTTIDCSEGRQPTKVGGVSTVNDLTTRGPANDPQDLERLLVARENAGDVTGMTALFEPDAVVDIGGGTFLRGKEATHEFFTKLQVTGFGPEKRKFEFGEQRPALICGDLALTSTRSRDGTVTSEVARRQKDGTWLWVIDRYSVSW